MFLTCRETGSESETSTQRQGATERNSYRSTVLLNEVLIRGTVIVGLDLIAVIVGYRQTGRETDRKRDRQADRQSRRESRSPTTGSRQIVS